MNKICAVLVLCVYFSEIVSQFCKETTTGYYSTTLTCTNGTRYFPPVNKSITHIECLDCNISILNQETIIKKFKGGYFNLSNSHVEIIADNVFSEFSSDVRTFVFENNEIRYIAPKVFNSFSSLEQINFRNSNIVQLSDEVFNGTKVTKLILSQNRITNIDHMFNGLRVAALNISRNLIREVDKDCFSKTSFVKGREFSDTQFVDLSSNLISKISMGTFRCYNSYAENCFKILHLNKNLITRIEDGTFLGSENLRILHLSDNKIAHLSSNSFKGLTNLNELHLRNNSIEQIPMGIFADLHYLYFLDLSQNLLFTLAGSSFSGLPNLDTLNISHNTLRDFNNFHIFPLGQLGTLDISDINVFDVDIKSILQHNVKLHELVLNDNFWQCSRLVKIYSEINIKCGGFKRPTHHFDVPNLHGIACSHKKLDSYNNLSFNDFLSIISKDGLSEDWLNVESSNVDANVHSNNTKSISNKCLGDIYGMVLFW